MFAATLAALVGWSSGAQAQGIITTVAGGATPNNIPALSASIGDATAVASDAAGNVYFTSNGLHVVFKVDTAGTLTTFAGIGRSGFSGDGGPAALAALSLPHGIAVDSAGNVFISDLGNRRIRRVDAVTRTITSVAGGGCCVLGDGGPALSAMIEPWGLDVDAAGNIFVADLSRVRRIDAVSGIISTVAGDGAFAFGGDGGPATGASLNFPRSVTVDAAGNLLIADTDNHRVRRVDAASGVITTVAGTGAFALAGDGGPAINASLALPWDVAIDGAGDILIADYANGRLRRIDRLTGTINSEIGGFAVVGVAVAGSGISCWSTHSAAVSPARCRDPGRSRRLQVGAQPGATADPRCRQRSQVPRA